MRILLVEPNVRERGKLRRALTLEGYSVRPARDSREAVRLFLAQPVDLLLVSQSRAGAGRRGGLRVAYGNQTLLASHRGHPSAARSRVEQPLERPCDD